MAIKLQDTLSYPPRGMDVARAAAYCGLSKATFLRAVESGEFPRPKEIGGSAIRWDRLELDAAWDAKEDRRQGVSRGDASADDLMAEHDRAQTPKSMGDRFIEAMQQKRDRQAARRRQER